MTGDSLPTKKAGGAFEKELFDHLSKEILSLSELMMTFRTRVSFIIWLGPFIVVGALLVATKEVPTSFNPGRLGWACLAVAAGLYFVLGEVLRRIESHMWDQCNRWRSLIAQINAGLSEPPPDEKVVFGHNLKLGYRWVETMFLLIFVSLSVGAWQTIHRPLPE